MYKLSILAIKQMFLQCIIRSNSNWMVSKFIALILFQCKLCYISYFKVYATKINTKVYKIVEK